MLVAALVRAHRRADLLEQVLDELVRYGTFPGIEMLIHMTLDRPTQDVLKVAAQSSERLFKLRELTFPLCSAFGERFAEGLNIQLADLEELERKPDWLYLADDDRWFPPDTIERELPEALANPHIDLWYARSIFFWDSPSKYNPARYHHAPVFSRFIPGDRFPQNRMIQAPAGIHDSAIIQGRVGTLCSPLLDWGSFTQEDREALYRQYEEAGKIDDYTTSLLRPPRDGLRTYPTDALAAGLLPWNLCSSHS